MSAGPPPFLRRLLERILPRGRVRDGLLGDLDELYAERVGRGRFAADLWYARQVMSAVSHYSIGGRSGTAHRDTRVPWLDHLRSDVARACRRLARSPAFTIIVSLILALGIGATTAIFSVVDGLLLRPLPYPEHDRLVRVLHHPREDDGSSGGPFSREDFADVQRSTAGFESLAAYSGPGPRVLTGRGEAEEITVASVTTELFETLGVPAAIGRTINGEDVLGADQVAVLSDGFWRSRFGADPGVLGTTITLDGTTLTVLGVMPPDFDFPTRETQAFIPVSLLGCDDIPCTRGARFLRAVGRLDRGADVATASAATRSVLAGLERSFPESNEGRTGTVTSLQEALAANVRPQLFVLLGAVGFLLLITCANVANLLIARGANRRREFAVHAALGAGRARVASQVLAESLVLSTLGGVLGFLLANRGVDLLVALGGGSIPRSHAIQPDLRVAGFALFASTLTGILFGVLPALAASRLNLHDDLRDGGRRGGGGPASLGSRGMLVGAQAAVAVILVTGATLLARSFWNLTRVDAGFTAENVLSLTIRTDGDVMSGEERNAYRRELVGRLEMLPGVVAVGGAKDLPLHGVTEGYSFALPERPERAERYETVIVTGSFFEALGIPLHAGRLFTDDDETDRAAAVIVDRALARRHWPNGEAVGETLLLQERVPVEVVGVVGDVRFSGITQAPRPTVYVLPHMGGRSSLTVFVRTAADPRSLADAARRTVWDVNPDQPVGVSTLSQVRSATIAEPWFVTALLGSFAGLATVLAVLGVYGVTAYDASRRTYELGVRIALGAKATDVLALITVKGIAPMATGVIIGLVAAGALSRMLANQLYGVEALDPLTFAAVPVLLAALGLLAVYVPARRATRVDPRVALLAE
jgi:predicted permease